MQGSEHQLITERHPEPPAYESPVPVNGVTSASATLLDPLELESLKLIMDASLRVHARHHFFTWTQGLLQNLVKHEALICALRNAEPMSFHVDSFSTSPLEPALFSDMFRQDTSMVPHIIKTWEENSYRPVVCETGAMPGADDGSKAGLLHRTDRAVPAPGMGAHPDRPAGRKRRRTFRRCRPSYLARAGNPQMDSSRQEQHRDRNHPGDQPADGKKSRAENSAQAECSKPHSGRRQSAGAAHSQQLSPAKPGRHP